METFVIFSVFLFILLDIVWYSWRYGITPTPTSGKVQQQLLNMLPDLTTGQIVELGSGWGTLTLGLAHRFPHCQVIGYEISIVPYIISKCFTYYYKHSNLTIFRKDFFNISLKECSLTVCYLYPEAMTRLKKKFENELTQKAYIVSHTFAIPGWIPLRVENASDIYRTPIYLYQMHD